MIKLLLPVRDIQVSQPFGVNYLDFYQKLGMKGHNGIDFRAKRGCPINASHTGTVVNCGKDGGGGVVVELWNKEESYKTVYYHLLMVGDKVQRGIKIGEGEVIGFADNTGIYTTGDHLHFGMKFVDNNGNTLNSNNGYAGAVDPSPYFENRHGKYWYKPAAYHRYGRNQEWLAEWTMRFKNIWLHKQLIKRGQLNKIFDTEFINALVYGGWDFESAVNPAIYELWSNLTKADYKERGKIPFAADTN
jgi:murein DD-endopeptidase MepM/ murein hydrolase activator NlpD